MASYGLITPNIYGIKQGGVETFSELLKLRLSNLSVYTATRRDQFHRLPIMMEIQTNYQMGKRLWQTGVQTRHNALICNGMAAYYFLLRSRKMNLVLVQHGDYAGYIRSVYTKKNPKRIYALFTWSLVERYCVQNAKVVVSVSHRVRGDLQKYYCRDSIVIHNGVDITHFIPAEKRKARDRLGIPREKTIALFVGRFSYAKGSDRIISLANDHPEIDFYCIIPHSPPIKKLSNIKFIPEVPYLEMPAYYSAADLLLAPSRFEGCSYVILEALACGLPIITSRTGIFCDDQFIGHPGICVFTDHPDGSMIEKTLGVRDTRPLRFLVEDKFSLDCQIEAYRQVLAQFGDNLIRHE